MAFSLTKLRITATNNPEAVIKLCNMILFCKANKKSGIFPLTYKNIVFNEDSIYFYGVSPIKIEISDDGTFTPYLSIFEFQDINPFLVLFDRLTQTIDSAETTFQDSAET